MKFSDSFVHRVYQIWENVIIHTAPCQNICITPEFTHDSNASGALIFYRGCNNMPRSNYTAKKAEVGAMLNIFALKNITRKVCMCEWGLEQLQQVSMCCHLALVLYHSFSFLNICWAAHLQTTKLCKCKISAIFGVLGSCILGEYNFIINQ